MSPGTDQMHLMIFGSNAEFDEWHLRAHAHAASTLQLGRKLHDRKEHHKAAAAPAASFTQTGQFRFSELHSPTDEFDFFEFVNRQALLGTASICGFDKDEHQKPRLDVSFFRESYFTERDPVVECPSLEEIFTFLQNVFKVGQFNADNWIVTLVYTNRLLGLTGMSLTPDNWRPVVIGCLVVAQKVWDDTPLSNVDFTILYPEVKPKHINFLENKILIILQYKVDKKVFPENSGENKLLIYYFGVRQLNISAWLYAFYYFKLRGICENSSLFTKNPVGAQEMKTLLYNKPKSAPEKRSITLIDLPKQRSRGILS
eukprot:jgi/Bigna1/87614/estExt_fgenesh1_pg.C_220095